MTHLVVLAIVFFVVSTVFSMIGMGGGILYVPILLLAGFSIKTAPTISLALITAMSLSALFTFWRNRKVDWKLALVIDPPTDIMAFVGGYFSNQVPAPVLEGLLAAVLIVAGVMMIRKGKPFEPRTTDAEKWWYWNRHFGEHHYRVNLPLVLTATALIGILSGMLGITGGIIKLPIMVLFCGVPMDIAVATSTVMVAVTAISGFVGHALSGPVMWSTALILAVSASAGGFLGSHISLKTNRLLLKRIFGVAVLLIALRIIVKLAG